MKPMHRTLALFCAAAMLCSTLSGCISLPDRGEETPQELSVQIDANVQSLDPHIASDGTSFEVLASLMDGLTQPDANGNAVPAIATDWSVSADQKTWTFRLRRGALWSHTGSPVTAHDFVYAWKRAISPEIASDYAYMFSVVAHILNAQKIRSGEASTDSLGITAVDDYTLKVELAVPTPYFAELLYLPVFYPMEKAFVENCSGQFATSQDTLQSNGAFVMDFYAPSSTLLTLVKNEQYWDADRIHLTRIDYHLVQDAEETQAQYDAGKLDYVRLTGSHITEFYKDPAFRAFDTGYLWYLALNLQDVPLLQNRSLRFALSTAIDRETMIVEALQDFSRAAYFLVPDHISSDSQGIDFRACAPDYASAVAYDVSAAQAYLEQCKEETGLSSFHLQLLVDDAQAETLAPYLKREIEESLPDVEIEIISKNRRQVSLDLRSGNFQIALTRWGPDYPDPTAYLNVWHTGNALNFGGWSDPHYDRLLRLAVLQGADETQRRTTLIETEAIAMQDLPVIPLYEKRDSVLVRETVSGLIHLTFGPETIYKDVVISED